MDNFVGTFKHDRDENFEELMKAKGVPYISRKLMLRANPTLVVTRTGEKSFSLTVHTAIKTVKVEWTVGEEAEAEDPRGSRARYVWTMEDDGVLWQTPVAGQSGKGADVRVGRRFTPTGMEQTMVHLPSGTTAKRLFRRV